MRTLETMTREERVLLLYVETCAVDKAGRLDSRCINDADHETLKQWNTEGFVWNGRIASDDCTVNGSTWVQLSELAWAIVASERRARAGRMWNTRIYRTTEEKREGLPPPAER